MPVFFNMRNSWADYYFPTDPAQTIYNLRVLVQTSGVRATVPKGLEALVKKYTINATPSGKYGHISDYFSKAFYADRVFKPTVMEMAVDMENDPMYVFFNEVALPFYTDTYILSKCIAPGKTEVSDQDKKDMELYILTNGRESVYESSGKTADTVSRPVVHEAHA